VADLSLDKLMLVSYAGADRVSFKAERWVEREEKIAMEKNDLVVPKGQEILYNNFHFTPAVKDKDRLYCSGVIGMGPDGKVSSDPETQFTRAFESVTGVLESAGLSFHDLIDITSFHVGLQANLRKSWR
jgi:enamine deaminase RidA (YjgF/YER057c/UK114 family)